MKRVLFLTLAIVLISASSHAFDEPNGNYASEYGGQLSLAYMGEGMVSVTLTTEGCSFSDDSGQSGTFADHGITARNAQGEVVMVIMYDADYAVIYADYPAMDAFCPSYNDATDYYPAR